MRVLFVVRTWCRALGEGEHAAYPHHTYGLPAMNIVPAVSLPIALLWGVVTATGIMAGALLGVFAPLSHRTIARAMSLGAGLLLAAAAVELAAEVTRTSPWAGIAALLVGAAAFSTANA